jgi:Domain of unknown function (DUF4390)
VITTVFSTRCWKSAHWADRAHCALALLLLALAFFVPAAGARAETAVDITELSVERTEEGVFVTAAVTFELPPIVEEALQKGIPMYFVAEAFMFRDRWYWYDQRVTGARRHMRLAYQPLTRRWRLNLSPAPITSVGLGVILNFDSLSEALAAVQRISRWKVAEAGDLDLDVRYNVDFRFRLDVSQMPRPFQIGAVGDADWRLAATRNMRLPGPAK